MNEKTKKGISITMEKTEYIEINGVKHFFITYEYEADMPVILYVHGGPGMAESLAGWEMAGRTEHLCSWVFYDQRGAGRTYYNSPDGLVTYEEIYSDLEKVVETVTERTGRKPFIMGHNWGTLPAIRYVREHPDAVSGYIGYGQVVDMHNITAVRCARIKELAERTGSRHDIRVVDKLAALTDNTFERSLLKKSQVTKLNVLMNKYNIASGMDKELMKRIPSSRLYDMKDLNIMMNGPKMSYKLSEYMKGVNLFEEDMTYGVPMMFISGDWDYSMPYTEVERYAGKITAPDVKMSIIKDTGCNAMYDNPDEFWSEVAEFVNLHA